MGFSTINHLAIGQADIYGNLISMRKTGESDIFAALQLSSTFFDHVEREMLKTLCFCLHVSSLRGICKAYCLLRGPIQDSENVVSSRRNGHVFITLEK